MSCSVTKQLEIGRGSLEDYKALSQYHYRNSRLGPYSAIFAIKPVHGGASSALRGNIAAVPAAAKRRIWRGRDSALRLGEPIGVIVYTMPSPALELRNAATENFFAGFDRSTQLALVNKNVRCIGRVIIEPRFRGLGLASRLVRETMPKMDVPIVEALAVMGLVNPFFEKAGMKAYKAKLPVRCVQMLEALSMVGVEEEILISPEKVQQRLDKLGEAEGEFIELQIRDFLGSYGKNRYQQAGLERTGFVLSKLTERPVYYIWFNENLELRI